MAMAFALRLVVMFTLIWCGLHIAEPAQAHGGPVAAHALMDAGHDGDERSQPGEPMHGGHHHCPVAADPAPHGDAATLTPAPSPVFASGTATMRSLTRAPPLQPPAT